MNAQLKMSLLITIVLLTTGCSSLYSKIEDNDIQGLEHDIANGADVNSSQLSGETPLHFALWKRNNAAIKLLLKAGANVHKKTVSSEETPLFNAYWSPEIAQLLIDHGANVNAKQYRNESPLHIAARVYSADVIKVLVKAGADINAQDDRGDTPLHQATGYAPFAYHNATQQEVSTTIATLLDLGADLNIKNTAGQTAIAIARNKEKTKSLTALLNYQSEHQEWQRISQSPSESDYGSYLNQYPHGVYQAQAEQALKLMKETREQKHSKFEQQQQQQACALKDNNWIYLTDACAKGFAHGMGKAETHTGLIFEGQFEFGERISGKILSNNVLMYDGPLQDGKPHGSGICMHEGEPEDCNYYNGKRTDALYKQRIEFSKQNALLAQQQKRLDEKLANINNHPGNNNTNSTVELVTDQLKERAAKKTADYIFDQLF